MQSSGREEKGPRSTQRRVLVARACNLNCLHCTTRTSAEADPTQIADVLRSIDAAASAEELVLTGGEPLLSPEIVRVLRRAQDRGVKRILVETNGLLLARPKLAQALRAAGVASVRINLPSLDPAIYEAVTRRAGVLSYAIQGARAAAAAGIGVSLRIVVVPQNVDDLEAMAARVKAELPGVREVELELPDLGLQHSGVARPELYVPYERLGPALVRAARAYDAQGIRARFARGGAISPCSVDDPAKAPELFMLRQGARSSPTTLTMAIEHCSECSAVEQCAGFRRDHARLGAVGRAGALPKRALRVLRDRDEAARKDELIFVSAHDSDTRRTVFVRVNYHCNQACSFCYIDRTLPSHSRDDVMGQIRRVADAGGREVVMIFSGGEPTLNPLLPDYIALATELGARPALQTNAVRFADPRVADPILAAGLKEAFVSMHGASAEVGDAVTEAPGTWARTVEGVDRMLAGGVEVRLNFVMTRSNVDELPAFADFVIGRFGRRVAVTFSLAVPTGDAYGKAAEVTPRMREIEPRLAAAIRALRAIGTSPTWSTVGAECMVPPCTLDDVGYLEVPWKRAARTRADPRYVKVPSCASCAVDHLCPGVREEYAEAFGTDELRPLAAPVG
jgi:MoaA/NifB/PqqE/SkfB family radical SAM enzyme